MATARPVVTIYQHDDPTKKASTTPMPHVLMGPLRPDIVRFVFSNVIKNRRHPNAVKPKAGYEYAAASWGTGRAVSRIPRVPGGGTHRAGQGAFGNMCRGGGMAHCLKTWRRWHRKVNRTQRRHAVASALAASSLVPLVMARGHRIGEFPEIPMVVTDGIQSCTKTKQAAEFLNSIGCEAEMKRVREGKKIRAGKGKARNQRRHKKAVGPLVIYNEDNGIERAFRNLLGVETMRATRLNILRLAPGGQFGRLLIWTESAFKKLQEIYGTWRSGAPMKKGYTLPHAAMENADIARIINSNEVQSVLRPKLEAPKRFPRKINPLKNKEVMRKLNPYVRPVVSPEEVAKKKAERKAGKKEHNKKYKKGPDTFYKTMMRAFETKKPEAKDEPAGEEEDE